MQAEIIHTNEDQLVAELIEQMNGAGDGPGAREVFRRGFTRLRSQLEIYPVAGRNASVIFESAARTTRTLAAGCLHLGIAVAMHLYPLCVLQCIPLPLLSFARFQRAMLLRTIRNRSLILANAGGERTRGAYHSLVARQDAEGIRIESTMASLRGREDLSPADAQQLRADATELGYIRSQPTADETILRSIGALPQG